jgi:hypothetical protein
MAANILLIGGSLNQTTMMHQISLHLVGDHCYFSPFYADGFLDMMSKTGLLNFTILGGRHRRDTLNYLLKYKLPIDYRGRSRTYDLVITGTDLVIQRNIRGNRLILIQEGITEPEGWSYQMVKRFGLPRYLANTATTGLSHAYDVFCTASPGYRDLFIRKGIKAEKIAVTGIPNFDHVQAYLENDFPYRGYVLAATSPLRESFKHDDRVSFIKRVQKFAAGRQLIFKLHPSENITRARQEIRRIAPDALIFSEGNVNHMIANCQALVTQTSTVTFVGLAMEKEVHSYLDIQALRKLLPIQNGGASAKRIANICTKLLQVPLDILLRSRKSINYGSCPKWADIDVT